MTLPIFHPDRIKNPLFQALLTLGVELVVNLGALLLRGTGLLAAPDRFPWMTAGVFILCFAVFNSLLSLTSGSMAKYWGRSIYSFLGLAFGSGLMAWLLSGLSIDEAGSYRWIFIVLTMAYLIFLTMVGLIRQIVEFAEREEWQQPRLRKRNRR